jgi:hypothetical protein
MIIALAGRRVDAADANKPRFPLQNVDLVRKRVRAMLENQEAAAVVCAAACGADLVALFEAGSLGIRRRIVLPAERKAFRESSVIDRPGDWGPLYDRVLDEVEAAGDLLIVKQPPGDAGYSAANLAILDEAISLAKSLHVSTGAALVWDGNSRGADDITDQFGIEARKRGLPVVDVNTL